MLIHKTQLLLEAVVVWSLDHIRSFETPWTAACQAPLFMGFPRQEYWGGLPFPSPGNLPDPGIEPTFPALQAVSLPTELPGKAESNSIVLFIFVL